MAEWKEYTGSYEQIAEMMDAKSGVVLRNENLTEYLINLHHMDYELAKFAIETRFTCSYLICNPHLLADMICQQARTGQPVWVRVSYYDPVTDINGAVTHKTTAPDWNIPNAEYSFDEFKEEVWLLG